MDLCSQENPPKCSEKLEDTVMPKRNVSSLITLMTTDISRMHACPLMTSNSFFIARMTEKAIKTSNLDDILDHARNFDVIAIDEGQFFSEIVEFCEQLAN